jgi:hypothetical protein
MMYFSDDQLEQLRRAYSEVDRKYQSLLEMYAFRPFKNEQAAEFARHGFIRRVKTLARCVQNVYRICPPDRDKKLSTDELSDLAINLQGFVFNIFGCLENLAWVWAKEKDIRNGKGDPLMNFQIGFGDKYIFVRKSFSDDFRHYLDGLSEWFSQMENFRHALAHRIPLYVPPYIVNDEEAAKERELEQSRREALGKHEFDEYERLTNELEGIGKFVPWMTHSFSEKSRQVVFHPQIIADWNTVVEISERFLTEL